MVPGPPPPRGKAAARATAAPAVEVNETAGQQIQPPPPPPARQLSFPPPPPPPPTGRAPEESNLDSAVSSSRGSLGIQAAPITFAAWVRPSEPAHLPAPSIAAIAASILPASEAKPCAPAPPTPQPQPERIQAAESQAAGPARWPLRSGSVGLLAEDTHADIVVAPPRRTSSTNWLAPLAAASETVATSMPPALGWAGEVAPPASAPLPTSEAAEEKAFNPFGENPLQRALAADYRYWHVVMAAAS